jgi:hypothetical protein
MPRARAAVAAPAGLGGTIGSISVGVGGAARYHVRLHPFTGPNGLQRALSLGHDSSPERDPRAEASLAREAFGRHSNESRRS